MSGAETTSEIGVEEGEPPRRPYVWEQPLLPVRSRQGIGVDGAVLAALRRGIGQEPGAVPQMWPYYRELNEWGTVTSKLRAEHLALALFGVHQQSKTAPMHRRNVGVGTAIAALRTKDRFSKEAVERRFAAFATATSLAEAATHLRGLVTQLKLIDQGLDYTWLMRDLVLWQSPASVGGIRRRWGMQFFIQPGSAGQPDTVAEEF